MPRLLERDAQLARIDTVLRRAQEGHGGAVVVWGPAGMGKTSLLEAVRDAANSFSFRVLRARAGELERDFGFGVARQLFEPLLDSASAEERADWLTGVAARAGQLLDLPGAGRPVPAGPAGDLDGDRTFLVRHGLYWLTAQLATTGPICLIVDDGQWADEASVAFLAHLLPRLDELPLLLVTAVRAGEEPAAPSLAAILDDPVTDIVELTPLSPEAVGQLIAEVDDTWQPTMVTRCHRATGGVPLLVQHLVRRVNEERIDPHSLDARLMEAVGGRAVERWVLRRLRLLGDEAIALAGAVAIVEAGSLRIAADLAEIDHSSAVEAADVLARSGILAAGRPLRFAHPVVRRAVYDEIGATRRADLHRRAGRLLADTDAPPAAVAEHLLAAEPAGDPWVVASLRAAADEASTRGALDSAIAFRARALREPPSPEDAADLQLELGMAKFNAGRRDAVKDIERSIDSAVSDDVRVTAAAAVAYAGVLAGDGFDQSMSKLDATLVSLGGRAQPLRLLGETMAMGFTLLDPDAMVANRQRIDAIRQQADDRSASQEVLAFAGLLATLRNEPATVGASLALEALERAPLPLPDRWTLPGQALHQIALTLVFGEHDAEALRLVNRRIRDATTNANVTVFASSTAVRALVSIHHGDLREAEADARSVLDPEGLSVPALFRMFNCAIAVESLTEQGRLDEAEQVLETATGTLGVTPYPWPLLRLSRSRLRLAQRRPAEAALDARAVGSGAAGSQWLTPGWLPWRSLAAIACVALGDTRLAGQLASDEVDLARSFGAPRTLGNALIAFGLTEPGGGGEDALREAVELLLGAGAELDRARASCELGARLRRANRRAESRDLLRGALDVAHRLGAKPLAARAETELRATGARPRRVFLTGIEALTASERRTADLAAEGLTNREIGQALFVTTRTVETHLTSVFRKLHLDSREQLPSAMTSTAT